jgi:hypothetical protein
MLFPACKNLDETLVKEIRVSHTNPDDSFINAIKSYEIVTLDNNPEAYVKYLSDITITDSLILITDQTNCRVVVFDKTGNYIRSIGKKGRGPDENEFISGFTVNKNNSITIYDRNKAKEYSILGEIMNTYNMGFTPSNVESLKTGQMAFSTNLPRNNPDTDFAIRLTDNNLRTIDSRLPLISTSNSMMVGQFDRIHHNNDHVYFFSYQADTVYHITNKAIKPVLSFSFDKEALVSFELNPSMTFDQGDKYYNLHYYEIHEKGLLFFTQKGNTYCQIFNIQTDESKLHSNAIPFTGVQNNYGIIPANSMNLEKTLTKYIDPQMEKCSNPELLKHVIENKTDDIQIIIKISL